MSPRWGSIPRLTDRQSQCHCDFDSKRVLGSQRRSVWLKIYWVTVIYRDCKEVINKSNYQSKPRLISHPYMWQYHRVVGILVKINGKGFGRRWLWLAWRMIWNLPGGTAKHHVNLSRYSNRSNPKYKSKVLPLQSTCTSVEISTILTEEVSRFPQLLHTI
jgi:hypothetical protein